MEKLSYWDFVKAMREHNDKYGIVTQSCKDSEKLYGVIVYKQDNFDKPYTEIERSYRVNNTQKMFLPHMISNSVWGDCLDGKDLGVKLSAYDWEVEYCYFE